MSRITGSEAKSLMEAYDAVYVSQELTEEQIWEEVENWVNSLVEEGYDLSEYTWEEMYEEYISEVPINPAGNRPISNAPYQSRFARPMNAGTPQTYGGGRSRQVTVRPQIGGLGGLGVGYRGAELQQSAKARASQVGTTRQGTAGGPTTGGNTPIGPSPTAARPSAPARPAPAPARPAPTATSTANPKTNPVKPTPTPAATPSAAPRRKDTSITDMIGRSQVRQGAPINTGNMSSDIKSMSARGTSFGGVNPPSSSSRTKSSNLGSARERMLNQDLDLFDIIKGHLLDEGYAETNEAALKIMSNMSEEWKESILDEAMSSYDRNRQRAAQRAAARNAARKEGKTGNVPGVGYVSPRPERETWTDEDGRERHTSGARMPKKN